MDVKLVNYIVKQELSWHINECKWRPTWDPRPAWTPPPPPSPSPSSSSPPSSPLSLPVFSLSPPVLSLPFPAWSLNCATMCFKGTAPWDFATVSCHRFASLLIFSYEFVHCTVVHTLRHYTILHFCVYRYMRWISFKTFPCNSEKYCFIYLLCFWFLNAPTSRIFCRVYFAVVCQAYFPKVTALLTDNKLKKIEHRYTKCDFLWF